MWNFRNKLSVCVHWTYEYTNEYHIFISHMVFHTTFTMFTDASFPPSQAASTTTSRYSVTFPRGLRKSGCTSFHSYIHRTLWDSLLNECWIRNDTFFNTSLTFFKKKKQFLIMFLMYISMKYLFQHKVSCIFIIYFINKNLHLTTIWFIFSAMLLKQFKRNLDKSQFKNDHANYLDHTSAHGTPCHIPSSMTHWCDDTIHCLHRPRIPQNSLLHTSGYHIL